MYYVLYDKNLKTIGGTYILEKWSRLKRAIDFDEITIEGQEIPYSANPYLVVVNDKQGHQLFSGIASSPENNDKTKKTTFTLKDYLTLFNSEIIINWDNFIGQTVADYIQFVFDTWRNQIDVGLKNIICDVSSIKDIQLDSDTYIFSGYENVSAYTLIADAITYYELFSEPELNLATKTLIYRFKKASLYMREVKLNDFGINTLEKDYGDYNRVSVYNSNYEKKQEWALTPNNNIYKLLPKEYQELEYIQATGTQYIDCGYNPQGSSSRYIIDYKVLGNPYGLVLFGKVAEVLRNNISVKYTSNNNLAFYVGLSPQIFSFEISTAEVNKRYILDVEAKNLVLTAYLKDEYGNIIYNDDDEYRGLISSDDNLYLFGYNRNERGNGYILYSFKAYDNDLLIRDFIPCFRKSDGIVGLYDKVTNTFFENDGTGKFIQSKPYENFIYPVKNKNFIAEKTSEELTETQAINDASYEAVMCLANSRYQENIDLNAQQYKSIVDLTNIDFAYKIRVYMEDGNFKDLPVGEIETDSNGKHIIRLGYRIQELTQEL